jgi:hypothetical protein
VPVRERTPAPTGVDQPVQGQHPHVAEILRLVEHDCVEGSVGHLACERGGHVLLVPVGVGLVGRVDAGVAGEPDQVADHDRAGRIAGHLRRAWAAHRFELGVQLVSKGAGEHDVPACEQDTFTHRGEPGGGVDRQRGLAGPGRPAHQHPSVSTEVVQDVAVRLGQDAYPLLVALDVGAQRGFRRS